MGSGLGGFYRREGIRLGGVGIGLFIRKFWRVSMGGRKYLEVF